MQTERASDMYDEGRFGAVYEGSLPYCFVSYLHQDTDRILPLLEQLQKKKCRLWYDAGIEPGDEWPETIAEHISAAEVCLAFLSKRALDSPYIKGELHFASKNKIPVVCILFEDNIGRLSRFIGAEPAAVFPCGPAADVKVARQVGRILPASVFEKQSPKGLLVRIAVTCAVAAALLGANFFIRNIKRQDEQLPDVTAESEGTDAEGVFSEAEPAGISGQENITESPEEEPAAAAAEPREFTEAFADLLSACDSSKRYYDESGEWSVAQNYKDLLEDLESALKNCDSVDFLLRDLDGDGTEELLLGVLTDGRFRTCEVFFANGEEAGRCNTTLYDRNAYYIMTGLTEDGCLVSTKRRLEWDGESHVGEDFVRSIYQAKEGYLLLADSISTWEGKLYADVQLEALRRHPEHYEDSLITKEEYDELNTKYMLPEIQVYPVTEQNLTYVREDRFGDLADGIICQQTDHDDISVFWTE